MTNEIYLTHDAAVSEAFDSASGAITTDNDGGVTFDMDETHIVTIDAPDAIADAFDTDRFYKTEDVTTARPIKQQYINDGEVQTLVKPAEELEKAAWSFDNRPFTVDHPSTGMVKFTSDARGFWRNPHYNSDSERLLEDLYIPVNDEDAMSFVEEHGDVSLGFYNQRVSNYDGDIGSLVEDTSDVDGYQVNIFGNHVAGVRRGRCSGEEGCGLDGSPHGSVMTSTDLEDASVTNDAAQMLSEGDMVEWVPDTNVMGRIVHAPDDQQIYMVEKYEGGEPTGFTFSAGYMDVRPVMDDDNSMTTAMDGCGCGETTDAPSGIYVDDEGDWFGVAPSENADDQPKYELNNCNDVKDAWNLRGSGDYDIEQSTLEARIKRAGDSHNCPAENRPWESTENMDNEFDIPDLSLDALAEKHEEVADLVETRDAYQETVAEVREELDDHDYEVDEDECPCDAIHELATDKEELDSEVEDLRDELDEYRSEQREEALDSLVDDYGADRDEWSEADLSDIEDEIDRRDEIMEDLDVSVKNAETDGSGGEERDETDAEATVDGERRFEQGYGA